MRRHAILLALGALALANPPRAACDTFGFTDITSNGDPGTQYSVTTYGPGASYNFGAGGSVTVGAGQALFVFKNDLSDFNPTSIAQVYFQDGTLLGIAAIYETSGVDYSKGGSPGNLPGGNSITPNFNVTQDFFATPNPPVQPDGVNSTTEALGILFNLKTDPSTGNPYTITDVNNALLEGINHPSDVWNADGSDKAGGPLGLRIGIHVQGYGSSTGLGSQAFITTTGGGGTNVGTAPAPPGVVLMGAGIVLLGVAGLSRRRALAAAT
jgi:hypothetical protein